jgi:thioredoxin reductase (NADPH)
MSDKNFTTDIVIIGAGPVGLFAVFEAGMLKMKCHVVDSLEYIGGQCSALYPEKPIYDIPAYKQITGQDLVDNLREQADQFEPKYHLSNQVVKLNKLDSGYEIETDKGIKIKTKAIIIAAGCGAFGPHKPPLENLEQYEETGSIQYFVKKREAYKGKKIVIAGGGDSAVDWALSLQEVASKIYLMHRRDKFRAAPNSVDQLRKLAADKKIELVVPYQLKGLAGKDGNLEQVIVANMQGEEKALDADILLPFYGLSMELGPIADWGLNLDKKHIETTQQTMVTNIPEIFAIGDIANYPGKLKLIATGFAEAAAACHNIYKIVHPNEVLHFEYSTTKGIK